MSSIFYSTQEEQELIASNIKKMLNDRGVKTSVNLLSIIKNHLITVDNDFLIGYLNDSKMNKYLRPETLFKPSNFDSYLNETPSKIQINNQSYLVNTSDRRHTPRRNRD